MAADPPQFDVDDFTGAEFNRLPCVARAVDRFVQADGRLQLTLELRVVHHVVPTERLLNHHQAEAVQQFKMLKVAQSIRGVRIGHQLDGRKLLSNPSQDFNVPAWFDLYLDALVSSHDLSSDFFQQFFQRVLDADGDAAWNFVPCPADQYGQRNSSALRFNIPQRILQRRLGHVVAADWAKPIGEISRGIPGFLERPRNQEIAQDVPRGVRSFIAVKRHLAAGNLAPPFQAIGAGAKQNDSAVSRSPETGLKEMDQRHPNFQQVNPFDIHRRFRMYRASAPAVSKPVIASPRAKQSCSCARTDACHSRERAGFRETRKSRSGGMATTADAAVSAGRGLFPASAFLTLADFSGHSAINRSEGNSRCSLPGIGP